MSTPKPGTPGINKPLLQRIHQHFQSALGPSLIGGRPPQGTKSSQGQNHSRPEFNPPLGSLGYSPQRQHPDGPPVPPAGGRPIKNPDFNNWLERERQLPGNDVPIRGGVGSLPVPRQHLDGSPVPPAALANFYNDRMSARNSPPQNMPGWANKEQFLSARGVPSGPATKTGINPENRTIKQTMGPGIIAGQMNRLAR